MREWLLGLAPVAVVVYFLFYPGQFAALLYEVTSYLR